MSILFLILEFYLLNNTSNETTFTRKSFITVYTETYPLYNETGSKPLSESDYEYCSQPLVAISSFLNLPNQKRLSEKLSVLDILKNIIHWDVKDEQKGKFGWITTALAIPRFIGHLLGLAVALPSSTAKLIVELLPGVGEEYCYIGKQNSQDNSYTQLGYKIGHFIFSGLHITGKVLTPSIKGFFPSLNGENGISNFLISTAIYYSILALITTAVLIALPIIAFKISMLLFMATLVAETGFVFYLGYNFYKGCCGNPTPPVQSPIPAVQKVPQAMAKLSDGADRVQVKSMVEKPSCFRGIFVASPEMAVELASENSPIAEVDIFSP